QYDVIVMNPPYMGARDMNSELKKYINKHYPDSKSDLFASFMELDHLQTENSLYAAINMHSWMFLSSFEKLRNQIVSSKHLDSMLHLGTRAFEEIGGEVVQTTAFILRNYQIVKAPGIYIRLVDLKNSKLKSTKALEAIKNVESSYLFTTDQQNFEGIPGTPIAYWLSKNIITLYKENIQLGEIAAPRKGNSTSNNDRFLRLWYEVSHDDINLDKEEIIINETIRTRWYPYNKGGSYKKWYGNNNYIIDWYNDAEEIRKIKTAVIANYNYFMKPGLTWSTVSSQNFSIRKFNNGFIFDNGGCCIFDTGKNENYLFGLLNSNVFKFIFGQLNPTLNFQSGEVAKFPVILSDNSEINQLVESNYNLTKTDWDEYETSWDFKKNPLINKEKNQ